tara:strand:+ start:226 stop:777 length:552 start_codon:yes stop_codon:yes gene_type:complete
MDTNNINNIEEIEIDDDESLIDITQIYNKRGRVKGSIEVEGPIPSVQEIEKGKVDEIEESLSKYDKFKNYVSIEKNVDLSKIKMGKMTIVEFVAFVTNLLIFPAIYFQMKQTWDTQEAADIDIWFNTLQLLGGTPEGAVGLIIGYLIKSTQMMLIGFVAVIFRAFLNFYICFGKKGIIKDTLS